MPVVIDLVSDLFIFLLIGVRVHKLPFSDSEYLNFSLIDSSIT